MIPGSKAIAVATALAISYGAIGGALAAEGAGQHYAGEKYAQEATITLSRARAVALKAVTGTITDQELEKERGGSGLRYSFDIRRDGVTHEVGVDAKSGKLLENSVEGPNPD